MLSQYQREADADEVDLELILALLRHLCQGSEGRLGATSKGTHGAVLVFLPGGWLLGCPQGLFGSCVQHVLCRAPDPQGLWSLVWSCTRSLYNHRMLARTGNCASRCMSVAAGCGCLAMCHLGRGIMGIPLNMLHWSQGRTAAVHEQGLPRDGVQHLTRAVAVQAGMRSAGCGSCWRLTSSHHGTTSSSPCTPWSLQQTRRRCLELPRPECARCVAAA